MLARCLADRVMAIPRIQKIHTVVQEKPQIVGLAEGLPEEFIIYTILLRKQASSSRNSSLARLIPPPSQLSVDFLAQQYTECSGPSMEPTLYTNDVLLLERISVRLQKLKKGDIVICKCPNNPEQNICKRIVGLPGDKIRNGFIVTTIPYGHVWLEGDNRNNSTDSRVYGPIPQGLLRGRALCKILPLRDITMFTTKYAT